MSDKLPEWPPREVEIQSQQEPYRTNAVLLHVMQERDAALARMEALETELRWVLGHPNAHFIYDDDAAAEVRAKLAACERGSGG